MENLATNTIPTFESVWAALQETAKRQKEIDRILSEKFAETDRQMKETDRKLEKTIRGLENLNGRYGSMSNNIGDFAEDYFFNSFEQGKTNFFGEHFDQIKKNLKGPETDDEYDILLINGKYIGIIEVKFKAHTDHIPKILKKAETLKINFPKYANHKIYLALATLALCEEVEEECIKQGIAIIKQVGDTIVIYDKHLKTF